MTAASGRGRRADAERNARLLVAAARELFDERGPGAPLDEVAKRAGVGNATLYRHFPTRDDLLAAVYADEVAALCGQGEALAAEAEAGEALHTWLESFAVHVATGRAPAFAGAGGDDARRTEQFERWHAALTSTARELLTGAQRAGAVRDDLTVAEVLTLAHAIATSCTDPGQVRRLLAIVRHGMI
ncbi:TetR/AcrR family transcriptional regulator [Actinomadura sp. WMMA1423]|uniref:TetR/AcrR family transcriptional regulator n=1 Tax=Actinomadura sp. WMMA1423 TaxID=2591108 RepID=UPI001146839C|nr:TetR/AcrR family transcriptional regulator [Actinomadura sp. WMMA1423]